MTVNRPTVIAFSGGCFSGKTTTMEKFKETLEARGHKVVILDELVRKYRIESIDKLRENPSKYLEFQCCVIGNKIAAEKRVRIEKYCNADVVLIDRAITDSLFYLLFYVSKDKLTSYDITLFYNLQKYIIDHIKDAWTNIYDLVIEFLPISKPCDDKVFRPKHIDVLKHVEHDTISMLNEFANSGHVNTPSKLIKCDLNNESSMALLIDQVLTRFNL